MGADSEISPRIIIANQLKIKERGDGTVTGAIKGALPLSALTKRVASTLCTFVHYSLCICLNIASADVHSTKGSSSPSALSLMAIMPEGLIQPTILLPNASVR